MLKRRRQELEALEEIRAEQRSTAPLLDEAACGCLVRQLGRELMEEKGCPEGLRFHAGAIAALREAAEAYLVDLFAAGNRAAIHAGRTYVAPADLQLARELRGERG